MFVLDNFFEEALILYIFKTEALTFSCGLAV